MASPRRDDLADRAADFLWAATEIAQGDHAERMGADGIAHCHACDTTEGHEPWCPVPVLRAWFDRVVS